MDAYDFVHLALLASGGEVRGKTKLQKTMYFLGVLTDHTDELAYRAHFYGPYSDEVADAVSRLRAVGFLDQNVVGVGAVDRSGFEVSRYDYRLNADGKDVAQKKARKHPEEWKRLHSAAERFHQAGDLDYMQLSVAAKTHFMLRDTSRPISEQELADLAKRFGWDVTKEQVRHAVGYLTKLGLVAA